MAPAIQHTKQQLLKPFRFAQWARLALVGSLAGEMGSGGGCHVNVPLHTRESQHFFGASLPPELANHPAMLVALIAFLVVVGLGLFLLFLYINSVMRFILFDSIVAKECHIRKGWVRRRRHGRRYFVWQILLMLAALAGLIVLIGIPVTIAWAIGWFKNPGETVLQLVLGGIALFLLFLAFVIVLAVVNVMTKDFVVPQMALEDISAVEGWRRLWSRVKTEKAGYAGYIGMKIVLAIAAAIILAIVSVIVLLVLLIPIGGAAVLGGHAAGLTWNFYTITLAVVVGCIAFAALVSVIALVSVPAIVFFPAYSIYFFAARYPALGALLAPPPSASVGSGSSPPEPPPLPPTPEPIG